MVDRETERCVAVGAGVGEDWFPPTPFLTFRIKPGLGAASKRSQRGEACAS